AVETTRVRDERAIALAPHPVDDGTHLPLDAGRGPLTAGLERLDPPCACDAGSRDHREEARRTRHIVTACERRAARRSSAASAPAALHPRTRVTSAPRPASFSSRRS